MSKNESAKSRTESSSAEIGKTILSRSGSIPNAKLQDDKITKDEGFESTFRAIKPRIEANIARKSSGRSRSSQSRKKSNKGLDVEPAAADPDVPEAGTSVQPDASDELEKQKTELQALEIEKLRNRLEMVIRKNKQLEDEKSKVSEDRNETMKTIESLLGQNRELTAENTTLREQQMQDTKTIDDLQKSVHMLESRLQKLKEENRMLNEANLKAMKELQTMDQEKTDLSKSYKGQNVEIKKLVQDRQRDSVKLQQSEQKYTKLKADCTQISKQLDTLRGDIKKYKEVIEDLKNENKKLRSTGATASLTARGNAAPQGRGAQSRAKK